MERNLFPQQVFSASQRNSRRNRFFLAFFHDQCLTRSQWLFEFMDKKVRLLFLKSFWLKMANQSRLNDMFCSVDQNHTVTYSIWLRHNERSWTYPPPHPTPPPLCLVVSTTWPWWNGPPAPNWPSTGWTELRTSPSSRCVKQQPESAPRWEQRVKLRVSQSLQWAGGVWEEGWGGAGGNIWSLGLIIHLFIHSSRCSSFTISDETSVQSEEELMDHRDFDGFQWRVLEIFWRPLTVWEPKLCLFFFRNMRMKVKDGCTDRWESSSLSFITKW